MKQEETEVTPELVALGEAYFKLSIMKHFNCFDIAVRSWLTQKIGSLGAERTVICPEGK